MRDKTRTPDAKARSRELRACRIRKSLYGRGI